MPRVPFGALACRLCVVAFYESAPIQLMRPAASDDGRDAEARRSVFKPAVLCPVVTFHHHERDGDHLMIYNHSKWNNAKEAPGRCRWLLASADGKPSACLWNALQVERRRCAEIGSRVVLLRRRIRLGRLLASPVQRLPPGSCKPPEDRGRRRCRAKVRPPPPLPKPGTSIFIVDGSTPVPLPL